MGMLFDLTPNQALTNLDLYPHQRERIEKADIRYPVDIIFDEERFYILDGLHRVARLIVESSTQVRVRKHKMNVQAKIQVNKAFHSDSLAALALR